MASTHARLARLLNHPDALPKANRRRRSQQIGRVVQAATAIGPIRMQPWSPDLVVQAIKRLTLRAGASAPAPA